MSTVQFLYLSIYYSNRPLIIDKSVIRVGVVTIMASRCVQCLGVCIDRHLDMKKHVLQTISACSFYLRNINQISCFLPRLTKERVVNAIIVTSWLDYCNARFDLFFLFFYLLLTFLV